MDAIENRRILQLAALAVLCLAIAGPGRASTVPGSAGGEAACAARASSPTPQPECLSVQIGLAASPNPTPSGGTVSFSWSVSPATDCWDNLGNGAWGNYSFARSVTDPFTWVVSCTGSGVESATLDIAVEGPPPPDPPPPPPGDHNPKGWLDGVDANGVVAGWACDPDSYGAALEVRLYLDGAPGTGSFLGNPTASIAREAAVGDACGGNRNHGFAFTLPGSAQDGQTHSLYAYAVNVGAGNNVQLSGSPASFQLGSEPPPPGDCNAAVVLYELPNYQGRCWGFEPGEYPDLAQFGADDTASSMRVEAGYIASVFATANYSGDLFYSTLTSSTDAGAWTDVGDDNASALLVYQPFVGGDWTPELATQTSRRLSGSSACQGGAKGWNVGDGYAQYSAPPPPTWKIFSHKLYTNFCVKGKAITEIFDQDPTEWRMTPPWPFRLVEGLYYRLLLFDKGEAGHSSSIVQVKARFELCLVRYACVPGATWDSWIKLQLYRDGTCIATNIKDQSQRPCARRALN